MNGIVPINFMLMANTTQLEYSAYSPKPFKTFDLKGSIVKRYTKFGESDTLKDQNLLAIKRNKINNSSSFNSKSLLMFSQEDTCKINRIIEKDTALLQSFNFLDYSILFAIEKK